MGESTRVPKGVNSNGFLTTILHVVSAIRPRTDIAYRLLVGVVNVFVRLDVGVPPIEAIFCFFLGVIGGTSSAISSTYWIAG